MEPWDAGSAGIREHAEHQGWWGPDGNFARAYQDPETDLSTRTCRLERARTVLGGFQAGVDVPRMMAVLRDHNDGDLPTGPEPLPTICMHSNPAFPGETAGSMVVQIRPDKPQLLRTTIWTAFGSPCLSVFRPVYPFAVGLPGDLGIGSRDFDAGSPWWVFERLQRLVARAPGSAAHVRAVFHELESEFRFEAGMAETIAARHVENREHQEAVDVLRSLVDSTSERAIACAEKLTAELTRRPDYAPVADLAAHWDELDASVGLAYLAT